MRLPCFAKYLSAGLARMRPDGRASRPFESRPSARTIYTDPSLTKASAPAQPTHKKQIFSGIQPTSIPHIGNYFGAVKQWVDLQDRISANEEPMIISIVDLHAITIPREPKVLNDHIFKCAATLLACGIDPKRTILYQQSQVPEHGQLSWILGCLVTMPQLGHMHQFKFKSDGLAEVGLGLYLYPILQAADILLYQATHVPVGEDQIQHIELCREIASRFNKRTQSNFFPAPKAIETEFTRIRSLRNPAKKMSKSDPDVNSRIELTDSADLIRKKIRKAVTDSTSLVSYEPEKRPGVSTLVDIDAACTGREPEEIVEDCLLKGLTTGEYKSTVAALLIETLKPIQTRYAQLMNDLPQVRRILDQGGERARERAARNYAQIARLVGT